MKVTYPPSVYRVKSLYKPTIMYRALMQLTLRPPGYRVQSLYKPNYVQEVDETNLSSSCLSCTVPLKT